MPKAMEDSAAKYLTNLANEGLTAGKIKAFGTFLTRSTPPIDLLEKAKANRNSITESRCIEANKLYEILIQHSNRGKSIFADVSQAKYSDYAIYDTPSGTNEEATETPVPV